MYEIKPTSRFMRDLKSIQRRGYDLRLLTAVIQTLAAGEPLAEKHKDHALSGVWSKHRECYVTPDWLLIYKLEKDILILTLTRTGTHSDLFG
ncbi:type II toxin-antitoxin system YafQ family toxin [Pelotomaculum terephthalicicum JT]|uniref:type II toxin-antitoxin system YafQ family toxin n=1 Tax=Pelotomaculum TaxID=191373 RepID=UPI0009D37AB7|nr:MULTISPECIES: type II toxin-antitoxin system YafQ family toxin [Pelotomaculum]MCG9966799.1 type II toxin-antitoxin system YafQ family toxin [Pelotomaculum terephthalicicum JT]OPX91581.1 MAG: mRNA interferase YafQ [Pelotomaculum sp. PtaB.Bin117]OPY62320.1 MAG: mRNA interferase YafQ [Pelotomaculum sp. PtaU1.Bin065]